MKGTQLKFAVQARTEPFLEIHKFTGPQRKGLQGRRKRSIMRPLLGQFERTAMGAEHDPA